MKTTATLLVLLLGAGSALAQDAAPRVDYSRDQLMRLFVAPDEDRDDRGVRFNYGQVEFRAIGLDWQFSPIMLPLPGTRFTTTREWPDAFSLMRVPYATSRRAWQTRRAVNAELKRIDRVTKPKAKIKVTTKSSG